MGQYLEEEDDDDDDAELIGRADSDVPPWDLSCPTWWNLLQEGKPPLPDLPLDQARVDQALSVFKKLRIPDMASRPSFGEVSAQWVFDFVAAIFGAFDGETEQRMIRGYFAMLPKKNTKTTIEAGVALTFAILNERPMAEMILTGPSHKISGRAYKQAKGMIALDREKYLQDRFHVRDHLQTIVDRITESELRIQTFDESIVTGSVPSMVLIDELHLLGRSPKAKGIISELTGGMVGLPDAFWAKITTQSKETPAGVFKKDLKLARGIRDGKIKGVDVLPFMYEYPEKQQKDRAFWGNPDNWPLINPNIGRSVFISRLVKDLAERRVKGEDEEKLFYSQHLNIEQGLGLHDDAWAGADIWESRVDKKITFDYLLEHCECVDPGIDGGGLDDLLGANFVGREKGTGRLLAWSKAWCHRKVLKLREDIAPRLQDFAEARELVVVDKMEVAFGEVADLVAKVYAKGLIDRICVDRAGVAGIVNAIKFLDVPEDLIEGVHQGWMLSGTIKDTETMLDGGQLWHAGQALMAWCVGNAKVVDSGNAISITKQVAGKAKIDPLLALFIAMSRMRLNPEPAEAAIPGDYELTIWA